MDAQRHSLRQIFTILLFAPLSALGSPLSFEDAIQETTRSNADLQAARENLRSNEALSQGAYNGFLPTLNGNLGTTWSNTLGASTPYTSGSSATATLNQNLFSGFQDELRLKQAKKSEVLSQILLRITKAKISADLKASYSNLYYSQKGIELAHAIALRREENLHLVELRFESGRENKGSVLLSKAYHADSRLSELQAKNGFNSAQTQLAKILGRPNSVSSFETLEAKEQPPFLPAPAANIDLRSLAAATPEHEQAIVKEELAQNTLSASYSAFYPSLNFSGSLGTQGTGYSLGTERWSAGLTLSFPLFGGFKDYFAAKSSAALFLAASQNRLSVDQELLTRIQQAYSNFIEAIEKKKVDDLFYEAALTRAQIAREKYNNGLLTFEDWDVIENDLIVREKARLQSAQNQFQTEAAWEQVLGKGVIR